VAISTCFERYHPTFVYKVEKLSIKYVFGNIFAIAILINLKEKSK
jgi:hypothetical protein